jgi:hypothetical protein
MVVYEREAATMARPGIRLPAITLDCAMVYGSRLLCQ